MTKKKTVEKLKTLNDISAAEAVNLFNRILSRDGPYDTPCNPSDFPDNMAARDFLEGLELYRNLSNGIIHDYFNEDNAVGDTLDGEHSVGSPAAVLDVPDAAWERLGEKEKEVAKYVLNGLRNKEIASKQNTSEATVKAQVTSIFRKFGVNSRPELMALAVKSSLQK